MTLRQDQQQPLTRRQLREMERAAQANTTGEQQVPAVELPFSAAPAEPVAAAPQPVLATEAPAAPPVPVEAPQAAVAPVIPLTRRQLRALQQSEEAQQEPAGEAIPAEPLTHAPVSAAPVSAAPVAAAPAPAVPAVPAVPVQPVAPEPILQAPVSAFSAPQPVIPAPPVISAAPAPAVAAVQPAAPEVISAAPETTDTGQVRAYQPPAGHWSLGTAESFDDVLASGVEDAHLRTIDSTGSATGSMLVVPVVPSAADMTGPLNATGEVLLTGSIDLPAGLGSTGQIQGRFDGSDIDRMLEQHDRDARPDASVEPVAATRAIATQAPSASPNIVPPKKTSHRVGATVGVVGGIAALGIIGVVVAGLIYHVF